MSFEVKLGVLIIADLDTRCVLRNCVSNARYDYGIRIVPYALSCEWLRWRNTARKLALVIHSVGVVAGGHDGSVRLGLNILKFGCECRG